MTEMRRLSMRVTLAYEERTRAGRPRRRHLAAALVHAAWIVALAVVVFGLGQCLVPSRPATAASDIAQPAPEPDHAPPRLLSGVCPLSWQLEHAGWLPEGLGDSTSSAGHQDETGAVGPLEEDEECDVVCRIVRQSEMRRGNGPFSGAIDRAREGT